jgi:AcrR family transcriptional regulator
MAMDETDRKTEILGIARDILAKDGLGAVSFDAIARRLGCSKQAVLYWYPTKPDLLSAMFLPWLEAEAAVVASALGQAGNRAEAIGLFVRAVARFHLQDLDRYRMMYLVPQTTSPRSRRQNGITPDDKVYKITDGLYGALAAHLDQEAGAARKQAVAVHSAVLGLVLMLSLADALDDPLKHPEDDLIDALVHSLTGHQ